jgi:uncharacterized membrane protein YbhN (UPF0104 family)
MHSWLPAQLITMITETRWVALALAFAFTFIFVSSFVIYNFKTPDDLMGRNM